MHRITFNEFDNAALLGLDLENYLSELRQMERLIFKDWDYQGQYFIRYRYVYDDAILKLADAYSDFSDMRIAARPYFADWMNTYILLLKYFLHHGYEFKAQQDFKPSDTMKKVAYLRFDIHLRDLPGLYGYLDINKAFNLPSNAYLFWKYSEAETNASKDFANLNKFSSDSNCTLGLHSSPIDSYLIQSKCNNSEVEQIKWITTPDAKAYFDGLMASDVEVDKLVSSADEVYENLLLDFKSHFPDALGLAGHGGGVNQILARKYGIVNGNLSREPTGSREHDVWNRIAARGYFCGRDHVVDGVGFDADSMPSLNNFWVLTDGQRDVNDYLELCDDIIEKGNCVQILCHPATLSSSAAHWNLYHALCERMDIKPAGKPYPVEIPENLDCESGREGHFKVLSTDEGVNKVPEQIIVDITLKDGRESLSLTKSEPDPKAYVYGASQSFKFEAGKQYDLHFDVISHDAELMFKPWLLLHKDGHESSSQMVRNVVNESLGYTLPFVCEQNADSFNFMLEIVGHGKIEMSNTVKVVELNFPFFNVADDKNR